MAAKKRVSGKKRVKKQKPERGCLLSCCLIYLAIPAAIGLLALLWLGGASIYAACTDLPASLRQLKLSLRDDWMIYLSWAVGSVACFFHLAFIRAIWRWKRWGVYVLFLPAVLALLSGLGGLFDVGSLKDNFLSLLVIIIGLIFPYGVFYLIIRPAWKHMD